MPSFPLNAWVVGGRHRHHRQRDHFGSESDLYVTIDSRVGPWPAGTPVKHVLADIYSRMVALASAQHNVRAFRLDGYVLDAGTSEGGRGVKYLDAVVFATLSSSFTIRANATRGGQLTVDAYTVPALGTFIVSAWVV